MAGFVGASNRIAGRATEVSGDRVTVTSLEGLVLQARAIGKVARGDAVEAFVRPEVASLSRSALANSGPAHQHSDAGGCAVVAPAPPCDQSAPAV